MFPHEGEVIPARIHQSKYGNYDRFAVQYNRSLFNMTHLHIYAMLATATAIHASPTNMSPPADIAHHHLMQDNYKNRAQRKTITSLLNNNKRSNGLCKPTFGFRKTTSGIQWLSQNRSLASESISLFQITVFGHPQTNLLLPQNSSWLPTLVSAQQPLVSVQQPLASA